MNITALLSPKEKTELNNKEHLRKLQNRLKTGSTTFKLFPLQLTEIKEGKALMEKVNYATYPPRGELEQVIFPNNTTITYA